MTSKQKYLSSIKYKGTEWDTEFYRTNVYTDDLLNKYLDALKIKTDIGRNEMLASILSAAMYYETAKKSHILSYKSKGSIERNINGVIKPIKNLRNKVSNLLDVVPLVRSARILVDENKYPPEAARYINALIKKEGNRRKFDFEGFIYFLDFYEDICKKSLSDGISQNAAHKSYPLETWLLNLDFNWKEHSPIPFTAGKYYKGIGYNSEAVHILKDIMKPLDEKITKQAIGNKLKEIKNR